MKIAVMGYSGSGKSTLARLLGEKYGLPTLHLDSVQFLPNWEVRPQAEKEKLVQAFLDAHGAWVIDGNYTRLSYARRVQEADRLLLLLFNPLSCLLRVFRRYLRFRNRTRPDIGAGCTEKLDAEFIRWVLWEGRTPAIRARYRQLQQQYPDKVRVLRNQRELDDYFREMGLKTGFSP